MTIDLGVAVLHSAVVRSDLVNRGHSGVLTRERAKRSDHVPRRCYVIGTTSRIGKLGDGNGDVVVASEREVYLCLWSSEEVQAVVARGELQTSVNLRYGTLEQGCILDCQFGSRRSTKSDPLV